MHADPGESPLLSVRGLSKSFGGEHALVGVDFELRAGEIHALLGENGAGKSTLIKILAGVEHADAGTIEIAGDPARGFVPGQTKGLRFVHQDLGLVDDLSVAENLALEIGYEHRAGRLISFKQTEHRAGQLLERMGCQISPQALVGDLGQAEKVMVAVTRAFSAEAKAIVLDEATASLPAPEVERLAGLLRSARDSGVGFVFVTHRLDEIFGLADRVTVLRDGRRVATAGLDEIKPGKVVEWIVGEEVVLARKPTVTARPEEGALLRVDGLEGPGLSQPISFDVAPGEVLALTGLIGSGAQDVARMLGGAVKPSAGRVTLAGEELRLGNPSRLAAAGCSYVPGDRQRDGAIPSLTVRENFFTARSPRTGDPFFVLPRRERAAAEVLSGRFRVRPPNAGERPLGTLSGGNQQKVIVGRALRAAPRLVVLDDPTVGVDIGSRVELHELLRQAAAGGCAVILASSDFEEVVSEADRVLVVRAGAVACELRGEDVSRRRLAVESYVSEEELIA